MGKKEWPQRRFQCLIWSHRSQFDGDKNVWTPLTNELVVFTDPRTHLPWDMVEGWLLVCRSTIVLDTTASRRWFTFSEFQAVNLSRRYCSWRRIVFLQLSVSKQSLASMLDWEMVANYQLMSRPSYYGFSPKHLNLKTPAIKRFYLLHQPRTPQLLK